MARLPFTKMQAAGNDFVVLDGIKHPIRLTTEQIQHMAHRHFGIGCDQLLLIQPAVTTDTDFSCVIFNQDGSRAGNCGNGLRCVAHYLWRQGYHQGQILQLSIVPNQRRVTIERLADGKISVAMGVVKQITTETVEIANQPYPMQSIDIGNLHGVVLIEQALEQIPLTDWVNCIQSQCSKQLNIGFVEVISLEQIKLRVYERGVGETLACGSGACAAVFAGFAANCLASQVSVQMPGGELNVEIIPPHQLKLTGSAEFVFEGIFRQCS